VTDLRGEAGKFTDAMKADEVKASSWVARHPGLTLAIGGIQLLLNAYLALKAFG
jgi:hypothetical protein